MNGCHCGGCRDCLRAQGYDEDGEAVETVAANLLDEYRAIDVAHAERDAMKLFAARDAAIKRVLSRWADETARERLGAIRREAEQDAFEMAMED